MPAAARLRPPPGDRRRRPRAVHRLAPGRGGGGGAGGRQGRGRRRCVGDRLRGDPQQLLPAGDAGADGRLRRDLGVRSRGPALPRHRLRRARSARPRSPTWPRSSSASSGSATPRSCTSGERRGARPHAGPVRRLARRGPERLPARATRRLRLQPRVDAGPGATRRARRAPRSSRGSRSTGFELDGSGAVTAGRDDRRADRGRAGRGRRRARGSPRSGRCSGCRTGSTSAGPTAASTATVPMWTYWYLQEGEVELAAVDADDRRRPRVARPARRLRPPLCRRRRGSWSPTSRGAST